MEGLRFGPGGKFCHCVDLSQQAADDLTGIVPLAKALYLGHGPEERVLGLPNGDIREVLALLLETMVMFKELLTEELREALAARPEKRPWSIRGFDAGQAILRGHLVQGS